MMHSKHVRFSRQPTTSSYSPSRSVSSSSIHTVASSADSDWSTDSATSSNYGTRTIPLPRLRVHPHSILSSYSLSYDVSTHFSRATTANKNERIPSTILAEPATHPSVSSMTLITESLPWPIIIHPSSSRRHAVVTVIDVLNGIYTSLRQSVLDAEFSSLHPSSQARIASSYKWRYRRILDDTLRDEEKRKGLKRVDFLLKRTRWMEIISSDADPAVWLLKLA